MTSQPQDTTDPTQGGLVIAQDPPANTQATQRPSASPRSGSPITAS